MANAFRPASLLLVVAVFTMPALLKPRPASAQLFANPLTLRQALFTELESDSLTGAFRSVVSSDGLDVYVSSRDSLGIAHFLRDPDTGTLTFQAFYPAQVAGAGVPQPVFDLVISPDDRFIYVALGATPTLPPGIVRFNRSTLDGSLSVRQFFKGGASGTAGLAAPRFLGIAPSGAHLYVYSIGDGTELAGLTVLASDSDTGALTFVERRAADPALQNGLNDTQQVIVSPDGRHIYLAGGTGQGIGVFRRNLISGEITFSTFLFLPAASGTENVRSVAVSPDGEHAYAALRATNQLLVFSRDDVGGNLTEVDRLVEGQNFIRGLFGPDRVLVSPDGARVYVISRNDPTQVTAFSRDSVTGLLELRGVIRDGVATGLDVLDGNATPAVSPDSEHVYVPNSVSDSLAVFVTERPDLPCQDFPGIADEYAAFQTAFSLVDDLDADGVPENATLALIERASCITGTGREFDESITNAYLLNLISLQLEPAVFDTMELVDFQRAIAALMLISGAFQTALDTELNNQGLDLQPFYAVVACNGDSCTPARSATRAPDEPFSGEGDPDGDGVTNAEEWANTDARGGTILEFAIAALDSRFDGSTEPVDLDGDGDCFIATAAFGTPLARELYVLRDWRDDSLLPSAPGAAFVDTYYRLSPPLAKSIAERPMLRSAARAVLAPLIGSLKAGHVGVLLAAGLLGLLASAFAGRRLRSRRCGLVLTDHSSPPA